MKISKKLLGFLEQSEAKLADLPFFTEGSFLRYRNVGTVTLNEAKGLLAKHGLKFGEQDPKELLKRADQLEQEAATLRQEADRLRPCLASWTAAAKRIESD